jgi:hypothetical protein
MTQDFDNAMKAVGDALLKTKDNSIGVQSLLAIEALKSLGWTSPTECEAIRAAALNEAAVYMESDGGGFADEIRALATMPPEYVVVRRDDTRALENLLMQNAQEKAQQILSSVPNAKDGWLKDDLARASNRVKELGIAKTAFDDTEATP